MLTFLPVSTNTVISSSQPFSLSSLESSPNQLMCNGLECFENFFCNCLWQWQFILPGKGLEHCHQADIFGTFVSTVLL